MTQDEQRIAIAEWAGWKWYRIPHSEKNSRGPMKTLFLPAVHELDQDPIWLQPGQPTDRIANMEYMAREGLVLDYCNDMNAIRSAVLLLNDRHKFTDDVRSLYYDYLALTAEGFPDKWEISWHVAATATPAQCCEALLKALGLWKGKR